MLKGGQRVGLLRCRQLPGEGEGQRQSLPLSDGGGPRGESGGRSQECVKLIHIYQSDIRIGISPSLSYRKHALWGPDANWATPGENVGTCVEIKTKGRRSEDGKTEIPPQTLKERKFSLNLMNDGPS